MNRPIVILHGALGSVAHFNILTETLSKDRELLLFNFPGHGGRSQVDKFRIDEFSDALVSYLRKKDPGPVDVFGYSMGGYVALYTSQYELYPINKIAALGVKFAWNPESSAKEASKLSTSFLLEKAPSYIEELRYLHGEENWEPVLSKTAEMMLYLGAGPLLNPENIKKVKAEVLLLLGDKDRMVSLDETKLMSDALPGSILEILPETGHLPQQVDQKMLAAKLLEFYNK